MLTKDDISQALINLGIGRGDKLIVHSSLSSMGWVIGGAETVLLALLEVLGKDGLLVAPTFTHSGTEIFDVANMPSKNGAISEAVRTHPDAKRSLHPTHAPSAIGKGAQELMSEHLDRGPTGVGSPLDKLAKMGGLVLLLGVNHTSNTTIHVGEAYAGFAIDGVGYSKRKRVITPSGQSISVVITEMPGCSQGFNAIDPTLRHGDKILDGRVGKADCMLMLGADVIDTTADVLKKNPLALTCEGKECSRCEYLRDHITRTQGNRS